MNIKKWFALPLALSLVMGLSGCGSSENAVYVQSVKELSSIGAIAPGDRFPGMVVSENVTEIEKDGDKTIAEVLVKEGDDVTEGQSLFSYDMEQLQLTLDKQRLEKEQLIATIENYKRQIEDLEKAEKKAKGNNKLQYTIQIQSTQIDLKEAELNLQAKEKEVSQSEDVMNHATVTSPVTGRVTAINENGTDNYGNPLPYITIQQAGSFRIKGTLGELQRGGIMEGSRMKIVSRTDSNTYWLGTVTLVDYESPSQEVDTRHVRIGVPRFTNWMAIPNGSRSITMSKPGLCTVSSRVAPAATSRAASASTSSERKAMCIARGLMLAQSGTGAAGLL